MTPALTPTLARTHDALVAAGSCECQSLARSLGQRSATVHGHLDRLRALGLAAPGPHRFGPSGRRIGRLWIATPASTSPSSPRWQVLTSLQRVADCGASGVGRRVRARLADAGLYSGALYAHECGGDLTPLGYACLWVGTAARRLTAPVTLSELADLAGVDTVDEAAGAVAYLRLEALIIKEHP